MRSFFLNYLSLTEALDWRCRFEPRISTEQAFGELRELCLAGRVPAIGWRTLDHPRGAKPLPDGYRPFLDPPLRPVIEDIPAGEWSDLLPHGHQLLLKKTRLPVWLGVEIDQGLLIAAWLPVIEQSEKENRPVLVELEPAGNNVNRAARRNLPKPTLLKHLRAIKAKDGRIPAPDLLFPEVVDAFTGFHVTRSDVRTVAKEVWGEQPRGRRRKSAT